MAPQEEIIFKSQLPSYEIPDISMGEFLKQRMNALLEKNGASIALIDAETGSECTFAQLNGLSLKVASALVASSAVSLSPGEYCIFFSENTLDYIATLLGVTYLGLPVIPIAPTYGPYELHQQLTETQATILFLGQSKLSVFYRLCNSDQYATSISNLKGIILMDQNVDSSILQGISQHPAVSARVLTLHDLISKSRFTSLAMWQYGLA